MCEQCECSWLATYSCYALTVPEKDHYWHTADWRVFMPGGGVCVRVSVHVYAVSLGARVFLIKCLYAK